MKIVINPESTNPAFIPIITNCTSPIIYQFRLDNSACAENIETHITLEEFSIE